MTITMNYIPIVSDIDRLYMPSRNRHRGLLQITQTVEEKKHALADYLKDSQEQGLES